LDAEFGLVAVNSGRRLFAAKIRESKLGCPGSGPRYADPKIAPFGPVSDNESA
jgi:hypothetical protein